MAATGYSGTPLAKKLGIGAAARVCVLGAPMRYAELVAPLPEGVGFVAAPDAQTDLIHLFVEQRQALADALARLRSTLRTDAVVWVSWPKKASKVPTDITEDVVRDLALPLGLVDIKVCAVTDVWSGLKLVVRKSLR